MSALLLGGSPAPALGGLLEAWSYSRARYRFVAVVFAVHVFGLTCLAWDGLTYMVSRL